MLLTVELCPSSDSPSGMDREKERSIGARAGAGGCCAVELSRTVCRCTGVGGTENLLNWARREALPHPRAGTGPCRHLSLWSPPARSRCSTVSALGTENTLPLGL